jgi:soluble lytic murein transglycosylase-like protein
MGAMRANLLRLAALPLAILFIVVSPATALARQYVVRPGDSLWGISHQAGVSFQKLLQANSVANPDLIYAGQTLTIPEQGPVPAAPAAVSHAVTNSLDPISARGILIAAANHHGVRPSFILAVSWWESGWNPNVVSRDGAVGMMQVLPATATWAGPGLLGRHVDLRNPTDNAEVGAALLHRYLDEFGDPKLALAAYYQGEAATRRHGIYPSSHTYVDGIWALRNRFELST